MDKKKLFERFKHSRFTRKAEKRSQDEEYLEKVKRSSFRLMTHVKKAGDQVKILVDLVFGKETTAGNRISAIAALIYFISPLDFIPDMIPGIGYTEDIAIIGMVLGMITSKVMQARKGALNAETNVPNTEPLLIPEKQKKGWMEKKLDGIFNQVGQHVERTTQDSINKRMRAQLIIVAISLGGAIVAALITLLLKYVFKVF